ncbi:hypothetical protein E2C01_097363 [Portunus trituberculatus]|uniref:Uncharacterized protein n=1 Tax=Portunus trituberculatus TaxID=210409 RepID=A0A5B7K9C9_PORTR|nr:hypothetical protein [Portunus trituberculatus]
MILRFPREVNVMSRCNLGSVAYTAADIHTGHTGKTQYAGEGDECFTHITLQAGNTRSKQGTKSGCDYVLLRTGNVELKLVKMKQFYT